MIEALIMIFIAIAALVVTGNALTDWLIAREMRAESERTARLAREENAADLVVSARLAQEVDRDEAADRRVASRIDEFLTDQETLRW